MSFDFTFWCISLSVLLALMPVASHARKTVHGPIISTTMDHLDPSVNIFLKIDDLKLGKTMAIYLPSQNFSSSPYLLPREEANSIPFASSKLPQLLEFFSFSKGSSQAKAMDYTLKQCELEPPKGEIRFCATSLEAMLDFAHSVFGLDSHLKVLATKFIEKPSFSHQNYTILSAPKRIKASRIVACHSLPYPYAVFYCHSQKSETRLFEVSLGGAENGDHRVQAVAACHMDTSQWDLDHVSFRLLDIEPRSAPVCHFFPADHLVWVPLPA